MPKMVLLAGIGIGILDATFIPSPSLPLPSSCPLCSHPQRASLPSGAKTLEGAIKERHLVDFVPHRMRWLLELYNWPTTRICWVRSNLLHIPRGIDGKQCAAHARPREDSYKKGRMGKQNNAKKKEAS
ncbi:hypothetical protein GPALN_006223 [Globodera pallida]|nr:hypothetical protein GPALN_006223 [Globodera pallida]